MARIIAAIGMIVITIAMVTYFSTGAGKFIADIFGDTLLFWATRPILGSLADDCFSLGLYCFQWPLWSAAH